MQPRSLEDRVTLLENKMQGLPERVGALEIRVTELTDQFVQFREEVRGEFSATRQGFREIRTEMRAVENDLRAEMHALHAVAMYELNNAINRSMSQARTLHEEAMARIKLLGRG